MLQRLGATIVEEDAQFEPEAGAYSSGGHHHGESGHRHAHGPLAPIPVHQKIHRPSDPPSQ
jgi:urease accessory protein